jgi:hypothetical protein
VNLDDLKGRLESARTFDHAIGHITFRVRLPSEAKVARIYATYRGATANVDAMHDLLAASVIGMRGATLKDIALDGDDVLPDDVGFAMALLDERQDIAVELTNEIGKRLQERASRIEADQKN